MRVRYGKTVTGDTPNLPRGGGTMTTARQAREHTYERVAANRSRAQSDKGQGADASDECLMGDSSADAAAATDVAAAAVNAAEGGARVFWECPLGVARVCASGCWRRVQGEFAVLCVREAAAAAAIAVAVAAAVTIVAVVATVAAVVVVRAAIQCAAENQGRSAIARNSLGSPALRQSTLRECKFRFGIEGNTSTAWSGARVCNATPTREGSTSTDRRWRVPSRRFAYR